MKIIIAGLLIILGCSLPTFSQIGLKGGLGVSDVLFGSEDLTPYLGYQIDFTEGRSPQFGWQFGGFYTLNLGSRFIVQPELLIIKQGLSSNVQFLFTDFSYRLRIYYLHLPVPFYYNLFPDGRFPLNILVGPYFSYKLAASGEIEIDGESQETSIDNVRNVDWGLVFGVGMFLGTSSNTTIELRFSHSLSDMMETRDDYVPVYNEPLTEKARNLSIMFLLGYRLN